MVAGGGKRSQAFIRNFLSESWLWAVLICQTTPITTMTMVRMHPAAQHLVLSCYTWQVLETRTQSGLRPQIHYRRAINTGCIATLL
jgi:hypothetical protein